MGQGLCRSSGLGGSYRVMLGFWVIKAVSVGGFVLGNICTFSQRPRTSLRSVWGIELMLSVLYFGKPVR